MSGKCVRVGLIGTGEIGQAHLRTIRTLPEAEIVALCDIDEAHVRSVAEPLGAAFHTDGRRLIDRERLDALYICVPPHAHGDLEIRAAEKGLHLFIEKPVNLSIDRALLASRAIRKAGILSQVGYGLRYLPAMVRLKTFLADKEVGTAHVHRWKGPPSSAWWRRYDQSGGQLVEMTTHQVDVLRWVMGEVDAVSASYSFRLHRDMPDITIPDSQAVLLQFKSGASATVSTTCVVGGGSTSAVMEFAIRGARVTVQGSEIRIHPEDSETLPAEPEEGLGISEAFIRAVATGDGTLLKSPYEDALRSAAVTLAANRSAAEGGRVVRLEELLPPFSQEL
jgi:predicted dehydrogenase